MIGSSGNSRIWQLKLVDRMACLGFFFTALGKPGLAQIVPDNTLGAESSTVTPNVLIQGILSEQINGGAIQGGNLFHSFQQLGVLEGRGVYFTNPVGIQHILARVTGSLRSDILGRLGVLGNANLFLINPNGVVFGPNASLDMQGSFLATTANAVKLGDTGLFSASEPATSQLLTVSPSAFLFNTIAPQPIINQSRSPSLINQTNSAGLPPGLQVPPGQTLALIGGNVSLEGGRLTASGGRIELGSVAGSGQVSISQAGNQFVLGYGAVNNLGNISLSDGAFVDVSGQGSGGIQIQGARLEMAQGSNIWANTLGPGNGQAVLVKTTEAIVISDLSWLAANVTPTGTGTGSNLTIDTRHLLLRDGGQLTANTSGAGHGGNLQVRASESITVAGRSADGQIGSNLFAIAQGSGDAGTLKIDTARLLVSGGAQVGTGTLGAGKGGSLQITASESVELVGGSANGLFPSGLFTGSQGNFNPNNPGNPQIPNGGDAGNIVINTQRLIVRDGAQVISGTRTSGQGGDLQIMASEAIELSGTTADGLFPSGLFSANRSSNLNNGGDAGNIILQTGRLTVRDGAVISASTETSGQGGILQITASDSIELSGTSRNGQYRSSLTTRSGEILPNNSIIAGTGNAGNLIINTGQLLVQNGAEISSSSLGEGLAGDISITVRNTLQANNGTIRTDSAQSRGGNITLTARDIRLFGDSDINSNVASGLGGGGNIYLEANSILAFDDSDILAFARDGRGGNITLNTRAFFGENYRPALRNTDPKTLDRNNQVDINASGAVSGIVTIPDVSLIQNSLGNLPDNRIDTDRLLANSCIVRRNQPTRGSFIITGTGSLPQRPGEMQMSSFPTVDIETLPDDSVSSPPPSNPVWKQGDPIVEPQGVYRLPSGKLVMSRECSRP